MKKNGILNSEISKVLSDLGHTDQIVIADAGLPVPEGVKKIDLALTANMPTFVNTLKAVLDDMAIEKVFLAEEINTKNRDLEEEIFGLMDKDVAYNYVSHEEFKNLTEGARAIIRTGECTPFANIILQSKPIF
ncbi:D-ribose pyranase [Tetragenococcus koreensis]|uniref:D-ribose pyranase n=1 Tax=Tetragenococcus koreensis TaxID=290335 RepID=UPI000F502EE4|nr:D-ribose pyranase [Tetragenococcus koreensis]MDN6291620.1 D-ribose pyranase [Tetragenococcus halophilus]MDN6730733.1 D-ribose pyranase [Atopostipes suicloacalis]AYW46524.1 D-ribose pyranase [Tetragenococcus koreensis]MCF1585348.1 D-ribose pyranase [Tetragenococcus koreensis]MCF1619748.1 D-ribose pyranase [Tetragenococcus koreensis]